MVFSKFHSNRVNDKCQMSTVSDISKINKIGRQCFLKEKNGLSFRWGAYEIDPGGKCGPMGNHCWTTGNNCWATANNCRATANNCWTPHEAEIIWIMIFWILSTQINESHIINSISSRDTYYFCTWKFLSFRQVLIRYTVIMIQCSFEQKNSGNNKTIAIWYEFEK